MAKNSITYFFLGDDRDLRSAAARVEQSLGKTASGAQKTAAAAAKLGDGLSVASAGLGALGIAALNAASSEEEAASKSANVFGRWNQQVEEFAETAADSFGIARAEALNAAADFGNMFKSLPKDEAADMSVALVKLAADLASFNDQDPSEMLNKLRSGLAGEAEPLRRFGVNISAARVEAKALELGIAGVNEELTDAQKIQARYAVILEDTATAQGDVARTADSVANQQRRVAAQARDLAADFGRSLIPVAQQVLGVTSDMIGAFGRLDPQTQGLVVRMGLFAAAMGPVLSIGGRMANRFIDLTGKARELHRGMSALRAMAGQTTPSFADLATGALTLSVAMAGATIALIAWVNEQNKSKAFVDELTDTIDDQTDAFTENSRAVTLNRLQQRNWLTQGQSAVDVAEELGISTRDLTDAVLGNETAMYRVQHAMDSARARGADLAHGYGQQRQEGLDLLQMVADLEVALRNQANEVENARRQHELEQDVLRRTAGEYQNVADVVAHGLTPEMQGWKAAVASAHDSQEDAAGSAGDLSGGLDDVKGSAEEATSALQDYASELAGQVDPVFKAADAYYRKEDATRRVAEAEQAHAKALDELAEARASGEDPERIADLEQEAADRLRDIGEALRDTGPAALQYAQALAGLVDENDRLNTSLPELVRQLRDLGLSDQAIEELLRSTGLLLDDLEALAEQHPEIDIVINTAEALRRIAEINRALRDAGVTGVRVDENLNLRTDPNVAPGPVRPASGDVTRTAQTTVNNNITLVNPVPEPVEKMTSDVYRVANMMTKGVA